MKENQHFWTQEERRAAIDWTKSLTKDEYIAEMRKAIPWIKKRENLETSPLVKLIMERFGWTWERAAREHMMLMWSLYKVTGRLEDNK